MAYAAAIAEAQAFAADVARVAEADMAQRSERWRQSRFGRGPQQWADAWAGYAPEAPDDAEILALERLPESAE